jgi:GGDEF domain-containing protein
MTRQLNRNLKEFENTVNEITFERIGQYPDLFSEKQGTMYNEVKRARRYERPVSIVALKFDEHNIKQAIPKIIEEVHQKMIQRYVISGIARTLEDNTQDFDTIALRDDCFLIVLPEIDSQNVTSIAQNLQQIIKEQMNISIKVGMASYPENAITFDRLADLAMENTNKPQQQNV